MYLWNVQLHVLPMATTILVLLGIYMINMVFGYFVMPETVTDATRRPIQRDRQCAHAGRPLAVEIHHRGGVQAAWCLRRHLARLQRFFAFVHRVRGVLIVAIFGPLRFLALELLFSSRPPSIQARIRSASFLASLSPFGVTCAIEPLPRRFAPLPSHFTDHTPPLPGPLPEAL